MTARSDLSRVAANLRLDLSMTPFSRYGSYLAIARDKWSNPLGEALYLRTMHGKPGVVRHELFRLDVLDGKRKVPAREVVTPGAIRVNAGLGRGVTICLSGTETMRARGDGVGMQLEVPPDAGRIMYPCDDGRWVLIPSSGPVNYCVQCVRGRLSVEAPLEIPDGRGSARCPRMVVKCQPDDGGEFELRVDAFVSRLPDSRLRPFAGEVAEAASDFAEWLSRMPAPRTGSLSDWARAAYVNWSAVVAPHGHLKRPAMLMNKTYMRSVWCWDHCFNAMALSYGHPQLAWDQLMLMSDFQDENGFMPDSVNDLSVLWHHGKPPVHGWALDFCMRRNPRFYTRDRVEEAYRWLTRWTEWWLSNRVWKGLDLPYYTHGNDSGWDNATIFDVGTPVASPDLAAHLVLQMEVLGKLADRLGRRRSADSWRRRSGAMQDSLLSGMWRGDRFVGRLCTDGSDIDVDSLITCIPVELGHRLPPEVRKALISRIRRYVTAHGVATQLPGSRGYVDDFHSYWRGSVWAPSTMQIVDGLRDAGETRLAGRISRAACRAAARCQHRENWDPLTGEGRMDFAYTWTSSVYLVLAHEYIQQR